MRVKFIGVLLMIVIVTSLNSCSTNSTTTPNTSASSQSGVSYTYTSFEIETMNLINSHRVSIGLKALEQNNYISFKSEEHDNYMIANNVVNHDDFTNRSQNIMDVLGAKNVGENIAYNYNTPQSVLDAWLNSPMHKQYIEGDFTHFGISVRVNAEGKKYYTNIFVKI
ncbi:MAG: CAP domain-containing protein [Flavobacterium sp.]|uniref:CAP domain-containing protein n=1 Tax=Flavobacterium sp. TaxID=239 RepID=UPI0026021399|nr:CAP domain-containing protein [Flavobacterium sp.]MDD5151769.1 CAP domain-containing protein [Flavobacterium sp.]